MSTSIRLLEGARAEEVTVFDSRMNVVNSPFDPNQTIFRILAGGTIKLELRGSTRSNEVRDKSIVDPGDRKGPRASVKLQSGEIEDVFPSKEVFFPQDHLAVLYENDKG